MAIYYVLDAMLEKVQEEPNEPVLARYSGTCL
jgi:hypothetical protein